MVYNRFVLRACSSAGRALRSHRRGRGFESHRVHQDYTPSESVVPEGFFSARRFSRPRRERRLCAGAIRKRQHAARRGCRLCVEFVDLNHEGDGVARTEGGFVLFVEGAMPGDQADVEVTRVRSRYGEARLVRLVRPGARPGPAAVPGGGKCGGCALMHAAYPAAARVEGGAGPPGSGPHRRAGEVPVAADHRDGAP